MWSARHDWEISVALALLCHVALLYGFQIAIQPLATPAPRAVIEMALVPPPGDATAGGALRAPVELPAVSKISPAPGAAEVRPPRHALTPLPAKPRRSPMPAPAEVHAPSEHPAEIPAATLAPPAGDPLAAAGSATLAPGSDASSGAAGGNASGRSSETGSGPGTERGAPGVRASPRYRTNPAPVYPPLARTRRQQGVVLLRVSVLPDGRAATVELEKSSGFSSLDESALEAVRAWEFEPARVGARAVASEIQVPVRFQLAD